MADVTEYLGRDMSFKGGGMSSTSTGDISTIEGLENYKQAMLHRIITVQGSLAHRPNYGVGLPLYQNAISSLSKQQELAGKMKEQLELDVRTEEMLGLAVAYTDQNPEKVRFKVRLKVRGYGESELNFNGFGEAV